MKLLCISDTHNQHDKLTSNLLKIYNESEIESYIIHVGDACLDGSKQEGIDFLNWFGNLPFSKKIFIPGNHDTCFEKGVSIYYDELLTLAHQLGIEIWINNIYELDGHKVLVSNHIPHLKYWAFFSEDDERKRFFELVDQDAELILSHNPPYGLGDQVYRNNLGKFEYTGCKFLKKYIDNNHPKIVINGHIHEGWGKTTINKTDVYNVAILNEQYKIMHPIYIIYCF